MTTFKLSASLRGHEDDVRAVTFTPSSHVVSASRDATVRLWKRSPETPTEFTDHINSTGSAFINAVAYIQPTAEYPKGLIVSGGQETLIEVREPETTKEEAAFVLIGHGHNVCTLDTFGTTIVSGSWDGTARVWKNWETEHVLEGHEGAVWAVLALSETDIVTGGADKTIRLWRDGKQVKVLKGHTDCVRSLCRLQNGLFASCANDATIRIWSPDGDEQQQLHGHTNYIYSVTALPSGEIVSCGEDRTVRVWKDGVCVQTIAHPAISVWSVAACPNTGDIASGASDKFVRVFSRNEKSWASEEVQTEFEQSVSASAIPANQVGEIQKDKIPGMEALQKAGTKDGQVIMVRNGEQVEAHMWSNSTNSWTNVGTVVDTAGSGQKRLYEGKEYDFVFDVDIQEGAPALKLPYNASENPFDAARKFLEKNELPLSYLDTVGKFIVDNAQGVTLGEPEETTRYDPWGTGAGYKPGDGQKPKAAPKPKLLPQKEYLDITTANLTVVQNKLNEFNQGLIDNGDKGVSLNPEELDTLSGFVGFLKAPSTEQASSPVVSGGLEILVKIITAWPTNKRLPALDLLRLLAARSPLLAEYTVDGQDIISLLKSSGSVSSELVNNCMLAVRVFVNMFLTEAGRKFLAAKYEQVLALVKECALNTTNRNLKIAEATLLLNYSVLFKNEKSGEATLPTLERLTQLLATETDAETAYRNMVALGTLLTIGGEVKDAGLNVYDAKKVVSEAISRIQDSRLEVIGAEMAALI